MVSGETKMAREKQRKEAFTHLQGTDETCAIPSFENIRKILSISRDSHRVTTFLVPGLSIEKY
jgi:hypothetical protein